MGVKRLVIDSNLTYVKQTPSFQVGDVLALKVLNEGEFISKWAGRVLKFRNKGLNRAALVYNRKSGIKMKFFLSYPGLYRLLRIRER